VAIGDQDHGRVAVPVTAMLAGAVRQPLDLALSEIASFNCQVYDVWSALDGGTGAGVQHSGAGREANLIFVLPPNVYVAPR
jgi:hypothetical protein